jgi:hypothetical protein
MASVTCRLYMGSQPLKEFRRFRMDIMQLYLHRQNAALTGRQILFGKIAVFSCSIFSSLFISFDAR